MTAPNTTERIKITVKEFKPIGLTGNYEGKQLKFSNNRLANRVGNDKTYLVEITEGTITAIVKDYAEDERKEEEQQRKQRTQQIAAQLAGASSYEVTTASTFTKHHSDLSESEVLDRAKSYLREARDRIEKGDDESFTLLIKGSSSDFNAIRLVGQILGERDGVVQVHLWHFGPGSKY